MIQIYVAAPWEAKDKAQEARDQLIKAGFGVTSRWVDVTEYQGDPELVAKQKEEEAVHDVQDVFHADVIVLLNLSKSEGKAVETGLAIAWQKPVIIVGQRTNIFHYLPLPRVDTLEEAIAKIKVWEEEWRKRVEAMGLLIMGQGNNIPSE